MIKLMHPMLVLVATSVGSAQTKLYFTEFHWDVEDPRIKSMELDGTNVQQLFAPPHDSTYPMGLAVDAASSRVYWSTDASGTGGGAIYGANFDGSALEVLVGGYLRTRGSALDGAGKLYYGADGLVKRVDLDGSNDEVLLVTGNHPLEHGAPYVDRTNGHVYVGADGEIKRMNLDGAEVKTVVRGVRNPSAIDLDVANGLIYWVDSSSTTGFVGRARLDDTEFTVLIDVSPGVTQWSEMRGLLLEAGKIYYSDMTSYGDSITRADLDGSNLQVLYQSPAGRSPTGLALSTGVPPQPILDCNGNSVPDPADIAAGTSADCNDNGMPDECEVDPCASPVLLLDHGATTSTAGIIGGPSPNPWRQSETFQPFDVPPGGWDVGGIALAGRTSNWADGSGFEVTLFPDDGTGGGSSADERSPIASTAMNFRFSVQTIVWVRGDLEVSLPEGRYWLRFRSIDSPTYYASIKAGTSGLGSIRRMDGELEPREPIALRLIEGVGSCGHVDCDANPDNGANITVSGCDCSAGEIHVTMSGAPPGQFAYLLVGAGSGTVTDPPGAQGDLCLVGGPIGRYVADAGLTGGSGAISTDVLDAVTGGGGGNVPTPPGGNLCSPPGQTWRFQYWHRDGMNPSRFSKAISVTFTN